MHHANLLILRAAGQAVEGARTPGDFTPAGTSGAKPCPMPVRPVLRPIVLGALLHALATPAFAQAATGIRVSDAWLRTVIPSRPAAGYFTLSNTTAETKDLVGAASPACGMLMLHQSLRQNGVETMVMVKEVAVPAHGVVKFAPGGYHLMCMSPGKDVTPGHSVLVTLKFKDGASITATFPVRGVTGN
ncbi:MAG: copper chaperone PCu(A)C [Methylovirgula sp.]